MKFSKTATLAGVRLTTIRDLCRSISFYAITAGFIVEKLSVSEEFAVEIATAMVTAGYLAVEPQDSRDREAWYTLTQDGHVLRNAKLTKSLRRNEAHAKVNALLKRIPVINADSDLTHRVVEISAIGGYAAGKGDVDGIDLVVTLAPRRGTFIEESIRRSDEALGLRNYVSALLFGQNEVLDLIKGGDQSITFHDGVGSRRRDETIQLLFSEHLDPVSLASAA